MAKRHIRELIKIGALASSLSTCPVWAQDFLPPPPQYFTDPNGVDPKSMMLDYQDIDASIGEGNTQFDLVRMIPMHRFQPRQQFGEWTFSTHGFVYSTYDSSGDPDSYHKYGNTTIHAVLGKRSYSFTKEYMGPWEPSNPATSISVTGATPNLTVTVTTETGEQLRYLQANERCPTQVSNPDHTCGKVSEYTKPNGEKWYYTYGTYGSTATRRRLLSATNNLGYVVLFEYPDSTNDQPSKSCLINAAFTFANNLTACPTSSLITTYAAGVVTKTDGRITTYTSSNGTLTSTFSARLASDTNTQFFYTRNKGSAEFRKSATTSNTGGDLWRYGGTYLDGTSTFPTQLIEIYLRDPANSEYVLKYKYISLGSSQYQIDSLPEYIINPSGDSQHITYVGMGAINGQIYPKVVTMPEGNSITYNYDSRANRVTMTLAAKPGSGLAAVIRSASYPSICTAPKTCNKPTSVTDGRNNTTSFTYDPLHGGVLTETKPSVNGIAPVVRYTYAQRYALISNGSGGYVETASPIWVLTEERTCKTTATTGGTCAGGAADELLTTYDYGPTSGAPNNLWLRGKVIDAGSGKLNLRTCYGYDAYGKKISETSPMAGLASCP